MIASVTLLQRRVQVYPLSFVTASPHIAGHESAEASGSTPEPEKLKLRLGPYNPYMPPTLPTQPTSIIHFFPCAWSFLSLNYLIPSIFHQPSFSNLIVKNISCNPNATPTTQTERFAAKDFLIHRGKASARNTAGNIVTRVAMKTFIQVSYVPKIFNP